VTWIGLLLVTVAVSSSAPPDSAPRPISLGEAVAMAQLNAPAVIQAEGQKRTGDAGVRAAWAAFLPSVSVSAGASRQLPAKAAQTRVENGQVVTLSSAPWSFSDGLAASVDLFTGGRRFFDLRQAHAQAAGAAAGLVTQRYGAVLAVKQQFFGVIAARESEAAASAQLEQATQQLTTSILRLKQRVVTRSDSLRSEIQVHNARLAVLQARTALENANAALTRDVGAPYLVTAAVDESLPAPGLPLDDQALRALALDGPAVQGASASLEAARAALRGSWTGYLPSVTASYSRSGNGAGPDFSLSTDGYSYSGALRLSLSLPLFERLQRVQQVTQAQVALENAQAALRDARLAALQGLTQSLGSFHAADERVAIQVATVGAAEEDLREQQEKYQIGAATLLDVLTSQTTLDQARHDLIQARYDQRVAKAQLEALVGRSL
jgi:outer membrane protein